VARRLATAAAAFLEYSTPALRSARRARALFVIGIGVFTIV
jgi:hypothetical protein